MGKEDTKNTNNFNNFNDFDDFDDLDLISNYSDDLEEAQAPSYSNVVPNLLRLTLSSPALLIINTLLITLNFISSLIKWMALGVQKALTGQIKESGLAFFETIKAPFILITNLISLLIAFISDSALMIKHMKYEDYRTAPGSTYTANVKLENMFAFQNSFNNENANNLKPGGKIAQIAAFPVMLLHGVITTIVHLAYTGLDSLKGYIKLTTEPPNEGFDRAIFVKQLENDWKTCKSIALHTFKNLGSWQIMPAPYHTSATKVLDNNKDLSQLRSH